MKKAYLLIFLLFIGFYSAFAQTKGIKDLYWDYSQMRMTLDEKPKAILLAEELVNRSSELTKTQLGNVTYHLARLYEERGDTTKARPYYEKCLEITPDYYVPHLALGYADFRICKATVKQMNDAAAANNLTLHTELSKSYKILANKTLVHLEKAQACDPDDETLNMITYLYKTTKNETGLAALKGRLAKGSENCISLLDDEY